MKKLTALILLLITLASLCACGEKEETTPTVTATEPATTQSPVAITEFDFGSTYGKSYSNNTIGIGISLPNDFLVTATHTLASMNGFDEELMTTNLPKAMEETIRAYVFIATDNAGNYMNIIVENLQIPDKTFITGEEYFNFYAEETKKEYEDMEAEDVTLTPSRVYLAGQDYDVQLVNYNLGGMNSTDTRIAFPAGRFMAIMTIKGDTSLILNRIYGLN